MNSQNLQSKGAKAIGLPQDWGHMLRLILASFPMEKIEEKLLKSWNQKSGQKYLWKSWKRKTWQHKVGDDSIQKHIYIDVNQECGNHPNILPLFARLGRSLTSLLSSLKHEAYPHLSKNNDLSEGRGRGMAEYLILSTNPWGPMYRKTNGQTAL
jgi:hypothetical protein